MVALRPPTSPLCCSRNSVTQLAMSGPKAAYGPEKPDSRPIFKVPEPCAAGAAVCGAVPAPAPPAGGLGALGVPPPHAANTDAMVTAPAPPTALRNSVRREIDRA